VSKSNNFETNFLKLIFQATGIANIADNATTAPNTNLYAALHSADPGEAGTQTTSEVAYSGYARVSVARSTAGWTVVAGVVSPMANISFPTCIAGTATATHFSVGMSSTGSTDILYSGSVSPQVSIAAGVVPVLTTASTISED
jgi:Flp pilus assembly protein TadG